MSLPLTRRIARAALLIAAGAAPVVGAAGSANAAALPQTADLGSVSQLDGAALGDTLDNGARQATGLAGEAGSETIASSVPAAGKTLGGVAKSATPVAQRAAGEAAGGAGQTLGDAATSVTENGLPTDSLGNGLPTDKLPVNTLPLG
ncbi:ATP-binding protein [Streptomyces sp. NPDC051217]|uniref:ATP-binding protein n=1 Tax=Streptomyces sp. NPDC051217 TaxID=3365644 RepID=UPI003794B372